MNAQTQISVERSILELLADPERPKQLLELMKQAEAVQQKAIAAKIEADKATKAAADELAKAREVQAINTGKSALLTQKLGEMEEATKAAAASLADSKAHLLAWEQRLKAEADAQATMQAEIDRQMNEVAAGRAKLDKDLADAEAILARAAAVKSALG